MSTKENPSEKMVKDEEARKWDISMRLICCWMNVYISLCLLSTSALAYQRQQCPRWEFIWKSFLLLYSFRPLRLLFLHPFSARNLPSFSIGSMQCREENDRECFVLLGFCLPDDKIHVMSNFCIRLGRRLPAHAIEIVKTVAGGKVCAFVVRQRQSIRGIFSHLCTFSFRFSRLRLNLSAPQWFRSFIFHSAADLICENRFHVNSTKQKDEEKSVAWIFRFCPAADFVFHFGSHAYTCCNWMYCFRLIASSWAAATRPK